MAFRHQIDIVGKDRASQAFKAVGRSSQGMGRNIADATATIAHTIQIAAALGKALKALAGAMEKPILLAGEQEQAVARLNAALRTTGKFSDDASAALQRNASALQQVTRFGDEAILPVQAMLLQFGRLSVDQLPRATQAVIDFAEAQGTDLKGAAALVAKSLGSSTNALTRYGIEIDNTLQGTARFNALMSDMEAKVGGTGAALAGTFLGQLDQVKNAWGDLLEKVGDFVVKNEDLSGVLDTVKGSIKEWADEIQKGGPAADKVSGAIDTLVGVWVPAMIDALADAVDAADSLAEALGRVPRTVGEFKSVGSAVAGTISTPFKEEFKSVSGDSREFMRNALALRATIEAQAPAAEKAADGLRDLAASLRENTDATKENLAAAREKEQAELRASAAEVAAAAAAQGQKAATAKLRGEIAGLQTTISDTLVGMHQFPAAQRIWQRRFDEMTDSLLANHASLTDWTKELEDFAAAAKRAGEIMGATVSPALQQAADDSQTATDGMMTLAEASAQAFNQGALEDYQAQLEEFASAIEPLANEIGDALGKGISDGLIQHSQTWNEQFMSFGETVKQSLLSAFLEPIIGAQSAFNDLFKSILSPFRALGQVINDAIFKPLIKAFLGWLGVKLGGEAASAAATVKIQQGVAKDITASYADTLAAMMPGLGSAASLALVASFGGAAGATSALPAVLGEGAAAGAVAATLLGAASAKAAGGVLSSPTLVLAGEAGRETIVPETRPDRARQLLGEMFKRNPALAPGGGTVAATSVVNTFTGDIVVNTAATSPEDIADDLVEAINERLGQEIRI